MSWQLPPIQMVSRDVRSSNASQHSQHSPLLPSLSENGDRDGRNQMSTLSHSSPPRPNGQTVLPPISNLHHASEMGERDSMRNSKNMNLSPGLGPSSMPRMSGSIGSQSGGHFGSISSIAGVYTPSSPLQVNHRLDSPPSPESTESRRSSLDVRQQFSGLNISVRRTAPPIVKPTQIFLPNPNAETPTKGYPYAFPDPNPNAEAPMKGYPYAFPDPESARSIKSVKSYKSFEDDNLRPHMESPYSRSPELRVTHKLAERKRRKEMKDLFDELRNALPFDPCVKTSKWEILTKSIDHVRSITAQNKSLHEEVLRLQQELNSQKHHTQEAPKINVRSEMDME